MYMETMILQFEKVKLKNPILIEGLPGIGNVGRVAAGYMMSELKMKHFADLYSPHFLPLVILHPDGTAGMLKNEFFYYKGKERDIVVLTGDTQSINAEGHYDVCEKILAFAESLGVKSVITLGGFAESTEVKEPRIIGAVNNQPLVQKYSKYGIDFGKNHPVGTIVGASGILLGMSALHEMDALCLMGQTVGMPMVTDPKAAERILRVISKILNIRIDLAKLGTIIKHMESRIQRAESIHKQMLDQLAKPKEDMRYIG